MLSKDFLQNISIKLKHKILSQNLIKGGNLNEVYLLQTIKNKWVLKINTNSKFPDFFKTEQLGLYELSKSKNILSAQPIFEGEYNELRYLILEYIEEGEKTNNFWEIFGCQLSQMHTSTKTTFGLNFDNYIGGLPQLNNKCDSWTEFYITRRLEPQLKTAIDSGYLKSVYRSFETLYGKLEQLFPKEAPALLHGDLWCGNYIAGKNETPWLLDPSVYYGHREMDIAMTLLFGGFNSRFYDAYNSENPLEKNWKERIPLHQLYPLLVHINLFGEVYSNSVRSILTRFV